MEKLKEVDELFLIIKGLMGNQYYSPDHPVRTNLKRLKKLAQSLQSQLKEKDKEIEKLKKELIEYKDYAKIATPIMDKLQTENKELIQRIN